MAGIEDNAALDFSNIIISDNQNAADITSPASNNNDIPKANGAVKEGIGFSEEQVINLLHESSTIRKLVSAKSFSHSVY